LVEARRQALGPAGEDGKGSVTVEGVIYSASWIT